MMTSGRLLEQNAVSIVTCTKRPDCLNNLLQNYSRQSYKNKELIVIVNHSSQGMSEYLKAAKRYRNIRVYSRPDHVSLGRCLNYGVSLAKYGYIAKFDDDDYYAPNYLTESMRTMLRTNADIVGKRGHFMYLQGKKLLLFRYFNKANRYARLVQGATLLIKRHVFKRVSFPNRNRGECVKFCSDCLVKGYKIYSGSPYNFIAIRRKNSRNHTWIVNDASLIARHAKVMPVRNIRRFVSRS